MYVSSMSVVTELPIGDCRSAFEARLEEMIARMRFKFAAASALKHLLGRTNTLRPVGHHLNLTKAASCDYRGLPHYILPLSRVAGSSCYWEVASR